MRVSTAKALIQQKEAQYSKSLFPPITNIWFIGKSSTEYYSSTTTYLQAKICACHRLEPKQWIDM